MRASTRQGRERRRHSKKGQRPKKRRAVTQAPVMGDAGNLTGQSSENRSIKEARQKGPRKEGEIDEIDMLGGKEKDKEPATKEISDEEMSESKDVPGTHTPKAQCL